MRKWLNNYFDLTKGEFNGLLLLSGLILMLAFCPYVVAWLWPPVKDPENEAFMLQVLEQKIDSAVASDTRRAGWTKKRKDRSAVLFRFDPNTLSQVGWEKLGFSARQAQSILRYVEKGGRFRRPEDLKKMYVVAPDQYQKLLPYIDISSSVPDSVSEVLYKRAAVVRPVPVMVEVNTADTLELDKIRGIGPAFARRIVKYRERLGGFYRKEQLMEVFGLDSAKFEEIKDQVRVDASVIRKLNVNTAGFEELKFCPYLKYNQINAVLQYRKQHGNYANIADLKKVVILTPQVLGKLEPYLIF
nr:helix-hairpin-helix domain-containing protein [Pedobacter sp. ASV19]